MKDPFFPAGQVDYHTRSGRWRHSRSGVALILVLAFLVIIMGLIIAYLSSVSNELSSAKSYKGEVVARQLAESAVQTVMATISQATQPAPAPLITWASQPGMIWNFDTSGGATKAYKLYSSDNMVVSPAQGFDASTDVPAATVWSAKPAMYTDLNAPVNSSSLVFPIVDGNSMIQTTADGQNTPVLTYAPSTSDPNSGVTGFGVDPTSPKVVNVTGASPSASNNPVPMPVKWIYVLKDGTMTTPTTIDGTGQIVSWQATGVKAPTSGNPIVGRVAFWTDDETCKVNINTASEGTTWDTPRGEGPTDLGYAQYQPAQHEWQRYPGHPAMVSLSTIFPSFSADTLTDLNDIYNMVPRITVGGSNGGTVAPTGPITPDADRLFASVDELMFTPSRAQTPLNFTEGDLEQKKFFLTARSVAPETNLFDLPRIACWPIAKLSGTSYDPACTTAFDRLIANCATVGSALSGGTTYPYFFQRVNDNTLSPSITPGYMSPTVDISIPRNQQLYSYLQNLTSAIAPGFAATSFATKYGNAGRDQILTEIFDYIRSTNLADDNLGTSGGMPYTPYITVPAGSANTQSQYGVPGHGFVVPTQFSTEGVTTQGFGRAFTLSQFGIGFICNADGNGNNVITVNGVPTPAPNNVPPPGARWPYSGPQPPALANPSAIPILDDYQKASNSTTTNPAFLSGLHLNPGYKWIQAIIVLEFFSPSNGWTNLQPNMQVQITGLEKLTVTDANGTVWYLFPSGTATASTPAAPTNADTTLYGWSPNGGSYGSNPGWRYTLNWKSAPALPPYYGADSYNSSNAPSVSNTPPYPFISIPIMIKVPTTGSQTMNFSGTAANEDIQVNFYAGSTYTNNPPLMQTINIKLPAAPHLPVPNLVIPPTGATNVTNANGTNPPATVPPDWWSFGRTGHTTPSTSSIPNTTYYGRLYYPYDGCYVGDSAGAGAFFLNSWSSTPAGSGAVPVNFDVLRTVCPADSDFRLVAGLHNVPDTVFQPHANYFTNQFITASLTSAGLPFKEQVNDVPYPTSASVYYPASTGVSVNYFYPEAPGIDSYTPKTPFSQNTWDNDISVPQCFDGPYINKPDEGNTDFSSGIPYYANWSVQNSSATYFTPNRIMTSPGMFGSLPTGIIPSTRGGTPSLTPWQTLLFRPQPIHPESSTVPPFDTESPSRPKTAPDHLLMDLFWMPVVEPYAISDTFSTAGKINMNYQIAPFTYITRNTALRALFKNDTMASILNTDYQTFKNKYGTGDATVEIRRKIDAYQTLTQFNQYFQTQGLFRSASQICDLYIVPADPTINSYTPSTMATYWTNHIATGDNLRERIYTNLYPRLTTKSNTYTVHFRAQALKQAPNSLSAGIWNEGQDVILGEYRGSSVIERYIDPSDPNLTATDFASESVPAATTLGQFYRWRVVESHRFAP